MKTTSELFKSELAKIPEEIKLESQMSFAIADKIEAYLQQHNLTQKDLAQKMGKTEAEVSRWLCGTHNFTLRTIARISSALKVSLISI